jgi:PAS domain S-box-containing protein
LAALGNQSAGPLAETAKKGEGCARGLELRAELSTYPSAGTRDTTLAITSTWSQNTKLPSAPGYVGNAPDVFRSLLESMTEGVCLSTEDGIIVYTNQAEDRMFGYEPGGLLGKHVTALNALPDIESARVVRAVIAELQACGSWVGEWWNKRQDGSTFYTRARITAVEVNGAKHWLCVHEDITEQRHIAEELEKRRRDLEDFFENGAVGLHWVGSDGRIIQANQAELDLLGYTRDEYIGQPIARFHADQSAIDDILARLSRGEALDKYPARLRAKDGSIKYVLISSNVQFNEGRFVHTRCFTLDITGRVTAEAAQKESEERLDLAIRARGLGIFDWYIQTGKVIWSEQEEKIFGLQPGTFEGDISGWGRRVLPEDLVRMQAAMNEAMSARQRDMDFEFRIRRPDGEIRHLEGSARFLYADDGTPLRMVGINIDVTARKRAEEEQQLLINELNHRVKNTLATVQSIALHTLRADTRPELAREALEERLMALSRAHNVLTKESWGSPKLRDIVGQAIEPYRTPEDERVIVEGPKARLRPQQALALAMALNELATNATKYGALSNGSGQVRLTWAINETSQPRRLHLRWEERGGPPVEVPQRRGFGSRLIERALAGEPDSRVTLQFNAKGVVCTMETSLG